MRAVIQRVTYAKVEVDGSVVGEIGPGLLVLLGVAKGDAAADADFLAAKISQLRIFPDDAGLMNRSVQDVGGDILVVSQFTLFASTQKGNRPSYLRAARPEVAWAVPISLGDSFHDSDGAARLDPQARDRLSALTERLDWTWITGNHDVGVATMPGGRRVAEANVGGIWLRHEAQPDDPRPEMSGHFHPKLRLRVRGKLVARRCFVGTASKLILPAFGSLTGGLDVDHPALRQAVGRPAEALVPVRDRMLRFPVAA